MSLFGQNPTGGTNTGGSLFPSLNLNTGADPTAKRKSIFEIPTSQSQTQSNLFGAPSSTTNTSLPSLFTNAITSSSASAGIVSNTTNPPAMSSIFGNPAPTGPPSTGLFGGLGNPSSATQQPSNAPPGGSLFGGSTNQAGGSASLFGNSERQAGNAGQNPAQAGPTSLTMDRDPASFNGLLERQKKKARLMSTSRNTRLSQIPSLDMDLGDLARKAQEIGERNEKANIGTGESRAHYLLAGSGVAPGKAYKDFQALEADEVINEQIPLTRDIPESASSYVKDLRTKGREVMMREAMDRVYREVDSFIEQSMGIDFEEQKLRIMEHLGLITPEDNLDNEDPTDSSNLKDRFGKSASKSKGNLLQSKKPSSRSIFGRSGLDGSMIGTPGSISGTTSFFKGENINQPMSGMSRGQTTRDLREKERMFLEKVEQLNASRLQNRPYNIMQQFAEVERNAGSDNPRQLVDAYEALREMTKEISSPIKERQYAQLYLNDKKNVSGAPQLKKQILEGSRTYLEKAFFQELESVVERNPREAQLGGRPTVINKVRAYIRVRAARRDLAPDGSELQQIGDDGDYCWIMIFYLLRSGFVKEATEYVNNDVAFQSTDRRFISYLTTYANSSDRRLSRKLQEMIDGEYQQRAKLAPKNSVDPYRMACYKIIGRCDLSSRNLESIGQGIEDWIWLQFTLARELDRLEEISGEVFGLDQICETITEIGQKHFQKGQIEGSSAYGTFFFMQILAGMFEQAIDYLHPFNTVSAVHFAVALAYYGLLRVSDFSVAGQELLTFSTTQQPLLNFVPLIAHHTTTFRTALPVPATDYFSLICLNSDLVPASLGQIHVNACHECLRELCLETREFARLLGDIRSDGTRIPGAIEQRANLIKVESHEEFLKSITSQAAAVADQRGQIADAVLLYHLCEDYDNVVSVLNRALADSVTLDLGESPMQLQPLKPRRQNEDRSSSSATKSDSSQSSLSLTQSTSSPIELAKNMITLYNDNASYYNLISTINRDTCGALLRLLSARSHLESNPPQFMTALEELNDLNILPLGANGSIPAIRAAASAFGALPQPLARCAGVSVVWAVRAIGGERDRLVRQGGWDAGSGGDRESMKEQLSSMAKDLMVFAGLVKYKLPGRVYDMLTRAGGDVGGY